MCRGGAQPHPARLGLLSEIYFWGFSALRHRLSPSDWLDRPSKKFGYEAGFEEAL